MDITTFTSLVSTLGFPIVCCIAMFLQNKEISKIHAESIDKLRESIDTQKEYILKNNVLMEKIIDKLGGA